ncbi:MAG TPA: tRNA (guanosine(46)-N7)-methyltransferase TrmB [Dokdonella sp.]
MAESADAAARATGAGERRIRSFVLRQGRFTPAQQRAFALHWPRYGLDYAGRPRDFAAVFGRAAPLVLEIGFGNGEQLLHAARSEPQRDFVGVEVHRPGVGRLMNALADAGVDNVRVYNHDAVDVLRDEIAPAALAEVRIYFPDPWHKKRHHKRRLIQPDFLALLAARVAPGGRLHLATDWADYAEQMQELLAAAPEWSADPHHADPAQRPPWRAETHFERRGLRLGHRVWDFVHVRR